VCCGCGCGCVFFCGRARFSYLNGRKVKIGPAKMADFSPFITKNTSPDAPNVKGCPKSPSSLDFGHVLTFWHVPLGEVLRMEKKCVIFYLGRVPSYFFFNLKRDFP